MDSGCTVPTLNSGLRATVAEKLLTDARARCDGALAGSVVCAGSPAEATGLMLRLKARFLAADNAGSSSAAMTATTTITTNSSIKVKARV